MRGGERSVWSSILLLEESLDLTGEQWEALEALIPEPSYRVDG